MQNLYKQEGLFLFLRLSGKFPRGTVNEGSSIVAAVVQAGPWPGNAMGMAKKKGERKENVSILSVKGYLPTEGCGISTRTTLDLMAFPHGNRIEDGGSLCECLPTRNDLQQIMDSIYMPCSYNPRPTT